MHELCLAGPTLAADEAACKLYCPPSFPSTVAAAAIKAKAAQSKLLPFAGGRPRSSAIKVAPSCVLPHEPTVAAAAVSVPIVHTRPAPAPPPKPTRKPGDEDFGGRSRCVKVATAIAIPVPVVVPPSSMLSRSPGLKRHLSSGWMEREAAVGDAKRLDAPTRRINELEVAALLSLGQDEEVPIPPAPAPQILKLRLSRSEEAKLRPLSTLVRQLSFEDKKREAPAAAARSRMSTATRENFSSRSAFTIDGQGRGNGKNDSPKKAWLSRQGVHQGLMVPLHHHRNQKLRNSLFLEV